MAAPTHFNTKPISFTTPKATFIFPKWYNAFVEPNSLYGYSFSKALTLRKTHPNEASMTAYRAFNIRKTAKA